MYDGALLRPFQECVYAYRACVNYVQRYMTTYEATCTRVCAASASWPPVCGTSGGHSDELSGSDARGVMNRSALMPRAQSCGRCLASGLRLDTSYLCAL